VKSSLFELSKWFSRFIGKSALVEINGRFIGTINMITPRILQGWKNGSVVLHVQDKENSKTDFVVIDIDYQIEPEKLMKLHGLVEKTGGKGYHVWYFLNSRISVNLARELGSRIASRLGNSKIEVFPKNSNRSFIRMPTSKSTVIKLPVGGNIGDVLVDADPCLANIAYGVQQGMRNLAAFAIANRFNIPKKMKEELVTVWSNLCSPPFTRSELKQISLSGYTVSCKYMRLYGLCPGNCDKMPRKINIDEAVRILREHIVGEERLVKQLLYIGLSSFTSMPQSAVVLGPMGSGKSYVTSRVLKLFPNVVEFSRLTERAIEYMNIDLTHKILYIREYEGLQSGSIRTVLTEGGHILGVVIDGKFVRKEMTGTPTLITTSTYMPEPELMSRLWVLTTDISKQQTVNILRHLVRSRNDEINAVLEQDINPEDVDVSLLEIFVDVVKDTELPVETRRDFGKLVSMAKIIASAKRKSEVDYEVLEELRIFVDRLPSFAGLYTNEQMAVYSALDGPMTPNDILKRVNMRKTRLTKVISQLEELGAVIVDEGLVKPVGVNNRLVELYDKFLEVVKNAR